ncbi:MAG: DegV family protein [Acholeplasma sp.]|nr:DegV family protein [Acholeplasma sp.]
MNSFTISKEKLYNAVINGAIAVINAKNHLNEINVFPVRDRDTGTNLASLMNSIIENSKIGKDINETLVSISNAALRGSKGNSGIIFSQFFYGITKVATEENIDFSNIIDKAESGYKYAYESIEEPVEGTIITLMKKWPQFLKNKNNQNSDYLKDLLASSNELQIELEKTKTTLNIFKKYDVVDAGAKAFAIFVEGFTNSLNDDFVNIILNDNKTSIVKHEYLDNEDIKYRYCTEVLIKTNLEREDISLKTKHFGDSLVIGKSSDYLKIHIHTNNPAEFIEVVESFALIIETKVDDMKNQYQIQKSKQKDICILTDSIADISQDIIDDLNIQVLPISLNTDSATYFDKLTINNEILKKIILKNEGYPKSSSPSIKDIDDLLSFLLNNYKKVIVITVSSKMSSTYNAFRNAINKMGNNDVKLIDSKSNSVSQGLLVLKAKNLIDKGLNFDDVVEQIKKDIDKTKILVHVDTLDNMVRGGRIKKSLGYIAKIIRLKPIVSIDKNGEGIVPKKTLGQRRNINKIIKEVIKANEKYGIESYAISHVNNLKLAESLKTKLINALKITPEYVTNTSSVIALNAGDKAVAVGYIRRD